MIEKLGPGLLVKTVNDSLYCINGRATSNGYDDVGPCSFECIDATDDALYRSMLAYLGESGSIDAVVFQYAFNVGDHVRLCGPTEYTSARRMMEGVDGRRPFPGGTCQLRQTPCWHPRRRVMLVGLCGHSQDRSRRLSTCHDKHKTRAEWPFGTSCDEETAVISVGTFFMEVDAIGRWVECYL